MSGYIAELNTIYPSRTITTLTRMTNVISHLCKTYPHTLTRKELVELIDFSDNHLANVISLLLQNELIIVEKAKLVTGNGHETIYSATNNLVAIYNRYLDCCDIKESDTTNVDVEEFKVVVHEYIKKIHDRINLVDDRLNQLSTETEAMVNANIQESLNTVSLKLYTAIKDISSEVKDLQDSMVSIRHILDGDVDHPIYMTINLLNASISTINTNLTTLEGKYNSFSNNITLELEQNQSDIHKIISEVECSLQERDQKIIEQLAENKMKYKFTYFLMLLVVLLNTTIIGYLVWPYVKP